MSGEKAVGNWPQITVDHKGVNVVVTVTRIRTGPASYERRIHLTRLFLLTWSATWAPFSLLLLTAYPEQRIHALGLAFHVGMFVWAYMEAKADGD
jgi:hypothetical protein